ncbi:MAG: hypothetical protein MJE77_24235 [Proteobacteria bacterium]|nr:hypothetical protein [Pseudomonadota bacterium]
MSPRPIVTVVLLGTMAREPARAMQARPGTYAPRAAATASAPARARIAPDDSSSASVGPTTRHQCAAPQNSPFA